MLVLPAHKASVPRFGSQCAGSAEAALTGNFFLAAVTGHHFSLAATVRSGWLWKQDLGTM